MKPIERKIEQELVEFFDAEGFEVTDLLGDKYASADTCPAMLGGGCPREAQDVNLSRLAVRLADLLETQNAR